MGGLEITEEGAGFSMKHLGGHINPDTPKVGIYWVVRNELVFDMVPPEVAEPYGGGCSMAVIMNGMRSLFLQPELNGY